MYPYYTIHRRARILLKEGSVYTLNMRIATSNATIHHERAQLEIQSFVYPDSFMKSKHELHL